MGGLADTPKGEIFPMPAPMFVEGFSDFIRWRNNTR